MSTKPTETVRDIKSTVLGGSRTRTNADTIYDTINRGWGLPETYVGDGNRGVPVSEFKRELYRSDQQTEIESDEETLAERLYGTRHPFVAAMLIGPEYSADADGETVRDADAVITHSREAAPDTQRGLVDDGIVKAASPVEVDPMIVDIQRSAAPVLDIIPSIAQPGFTAQYNQFTGRTLEDWGMTEADASDLSDNTGSEFALATNTKDMKIHATVLNVSDFSQRAEETLDYMDLMNTTVGQVMKEIFLTKAKTYFYGDPDGGGTGLHENTNTYEGLASFAATAGNVVDKTGVSSGFLEDMLDYLTDQVTSSGLTFGRARFLVSPQFYNQIYDEVTPVVRIDGYDADVEYGPQGLAIGHERGSVPITPCDNIRDYSGESTGVGSNSTNGDVFLYDENAVQNRQLSPMSTVPLGRLGLADRAAVFEYNALIDKSLDESGGDGHTHRLRYGSV
jgi:hypothetical protein